MNNARITYIIVRRFTIMPQRFSDYLSRRIFGYDVFVSYARAGSSPYSDALVGMLQRSAFVSFLDVLDIDQGKEVSFEPILERALRKSRTLVLLLEANAYKSKWVTWEISTFQRLNPKGHVIPIWLDGVPPWEELSGTAFESLKDRIALIQPTDRGSAPSEDVVRRIFDYFKTRRQQRMRKRLLLVVLLAVLAALCVGFTLGLLVARTMRQKAPNQALHRMAAQRRRLTIQTLPAGRHR